MLLPLKKLIKEKLQSLFGDRKGTIAVAVALAIIPITAATGVAVDMTQAVSMRATMQKAADAAVLAAASSTTTNRPELRRIADTVYDANLTGKGAINRSRGRLSFDEGEFVYNASGRVPSMLMDQFGARTSEVSVQSRAVNHTEPVEIAILFDTTNSMTYYRRDEQAQDALEAALEAVRDASGNQHFRASILPLSDRVNIGTGRTGWLDRAPDASWAGCVQPREEVLGRWDYAQTDRPPNAVNFVPLQDDTEPNHPGYRVVCPDEIVGPTNNVDTLIDALEDFNTAGTGRMDEALAWGWRLVSHRWRNRWGPSGYPSRRGEARKVVVMITDGHTILYDHEMDGDGSPSDYGHNNGSPTAFSHMENMCTRMKRQGIEIHMIWVGGNTHIVPYMERCASSEDHYHEVNDMADFEAALQGLRPHHAYARLTR